MSKKNKKDDKNYFKLTITLTTLLIIDKIIDIILKILQSAGVIK